MGTYSNGRMIATIDWTTMKYQVLPVGFSNDRHVCSCSVLRNKNGKILVAAAGKKFLLFVKKI
jgi:hypothetical protein